MGNSNGVKLKEKYQKNKYRLQGTKEDKHMKIYSLISFQSQDQFIKKVLNPIQFNSFTDINYVVQIMSQNFQKICSFVFLIVNKKDQSLYDIIFEYGSKLKEPLPREKYFWILIENIVESMVYLEQQHLFYPILQKRYVLEKGHKNYMLVNPFCFPQFFKEVLDIIYNPNVQVSKKNNFFNYMNKRNLHEFGMLVLSLLGNFDEDLLLQNPNYWQNCYEQIRFKVSQPQREFFGFLLDPMVAPRSFIEVRDWLINNKGIIREEFFKNFYFNQLQSTKQLQNSFQNSIQEYHNISPERIQRKRNQQNKNRLNHSTGNTFQNFNTPIKGSLVSNSSHIIFSNENINYSNIQQPQQQTQQQINISPFLSNEQIASKNNKQYIQNLQNQKINRQHQPYQEYQQQQNLNQQQTNTRYQVQQQVQKQSQNSQYKNQNINNIQQNLDNQKIKKQNEQFKQDSVQNLLVFEDEEIEVQTINEEPILDVFDELDFEFVNTTKKQNLQKDFFRQESLDQAENIVDQLTPKEQNFVKQSGINQANFAKKNKHSVNQISQNQMQIRNDISRILMKWDPELKQHVKYIEYKDGTQERVQIKTDEQELCRKLSLSQLQKRQPQSLNSIQDNDVNNNNCWKFILMNSPQGAVLLFKTMQIDIQNQFQNLQRIVDNKNSLKPSLYHNIDD